MSFNSLQFFVFFIVVYGLYALLRHKGQNFLLLLASYVFYGSWNWKFLPLIVASTLIDYYCGIRIEESGQRRQQRAYLYFSIFSHLCVLGYFKYFNFFAENFIDLLSTLGFQASPYFINVILPLGISFYTFKSMSYTIDIYRKQVKAERNFLNFALFISFFPQLIAGPIERASHLLPQISQARKITAEHIQQGSYLILWGLYLKIFVADNLGRVIVDPYFNSLPPYNGVLVLLASYAFYIQLYCDFAGYSRIAQGLGRLMGFDIMENFNLPFFAVNPQDFWRRWHISLYNWVIDYIYVPLFLKLRFIKGKARSYFALATTMMIMGLWHGAQWTYIVWGAVESIILMMYLYLKSHIGSWPKPKGKWQGKVWFGVRIFLMFQLFALVGIFFRGTDIDQSLLMFSSILTDLYIPSSGEARIVFLNLLIFSSLLFMMESIQYAKNDFYALMKMPLWSRSLLYLTMLISMLLLGPNPSEKFIYFQF